MHAVARVSVRRAGRRAGSSREQFATCSGRGAVFTNTKRARGVERGCGTARRASAVKFAVSVESDPEVAA